MSAIASGILLALLHAAFALYHHARLPFPTFGEDEMSRAEHGLLVGFAVLWLAWAISVWPRALARRLPSVSILYVASLLVTMIGFLTWYLGLDALNALADFSPKVATPIYVQKTFKRSTRNARGGGVTSGYATVNRLDHPDEAIVISWEGCRLPSGTAPSPYATIELGRGALGAPWFSVPIQCHPLEVGDRPLYGTFFLGHGRALIVMTIEDPAPASPALTLNADHILSVLNEIADGRAAHPRSEAEAVLDDAIFVFTENERGQLRKILDELPAQSVEREKAVGRRAVAYVKDLLLKHSTAQLIRHWVRSIEARFSDIDIAVIRPTGTAASALGALCARCQVMSRGDVDGPVLRLFLQGADASSGGEHIYFADGQGRRAFDAALTAVEQAPRLLAAIAAAPR